MCLRYPHGLHPQEKYGEGEDWKACHGGYGCENESASHADGATGTDAEESGNESGNVSTSRAPGSANASANPLGKTQGKIMGLCTRDCTFIFFHFARQFRDEVKGNWERNLCNFLDEVRKL